MLFSQITEMPVGPLRLLQPTLSSGAWISLALLALTVLLLFVPRAGTIRTLAVCAVLGAAAHVAMSGAML